MRKHQTTGIYVFMHTQLSDNGERERKKNSSWDNINESVLCLLTKIFQINSEGLLFLYTVLLICIDLRTFFFFFDNLEKEKKKQVQLSEIEWETNMMRRRKKRKSLTRRRMIVLMRDMQRVFFGKTFDMVA